jgi:pimeloyl-ACP methyl ester carboxylesterase
MSPASVKGGALRAPSIEDGPALVRRVGSVVRGSGEPVVLLHASLASKSQWLSLADRMASRFRVIALDLIGYGDNPMPASGRAFSVDDEVAVVAAGIDANVPPHVRVHIVGHSYGGLVALRYAQRMWGRVASLALYEPVVFGILDRNDGALTDVTAVVRTIDRWLAAGQREDAARAFVDFWSGSGVFASMTPRARMAAVRGMDKVALDFQAASGWRPHPGDFQRTVVPALLMSGSRSPAVAQRIVSVLARSLPDGRVATLDAGHMGPITDALRVNPWIEAFIDMSADRRTLRPWPVEMPDNAARAAD